MSAQQIALWSGWGWFALFLVWFAGTVFILRVVYRWSMQRFGSRLLTAVALIVWTLAILAVAGRVLGPGFAAR